MPGTRHDELVDQYKRATEVVRLARDRELAKINNIAHMPEDTVGDAAFAGLVFIHSWKAGVGISATRGKGFLVKKTGGENRGFGDWSGPVPIEQMEMSVGITLGTSGADMIMLVTEEEVKKITSVVGDTGVVLEGEITLIAGTKVHSEPKKTHRCYAISKGAMVDLSVGNSTMMLDTPSLRELHGEASVEDVLKSSSEGIRATSEVIEAFYQELAKAEDPKE